MNRNHHRIVFNAARGQLMAVSEYARSLGKASTCTVTTAAASLLFCLPLQAQISADPGAQGSNVVAAGDVNLVAGGAGAASNVRVQGSTIEAGDTARLKAEGDIHLLAATQTTREINSQSSKSGSVGIGFNVGGAQTGVSFNASASRSKGQGTGEETTHSNTHVQAGQRVELESGADTTLRGAVVTAPHVQARIGGDLLIESLQDRATYSEKSESASAGVKAPSRKRSRLQRALPWVQPLEACQALLQHSTRCRTTF